MQTPEIATVEDLVRVLDEHPQWREAVRSRLLTREVLELPQQLADLATTTNRQFEIVNQRLTQLERGLAELSRQLAEFVASTNLQFTKLRTEIGPIKAAHAATSARGGRPDS